MYQEDMFHLRSKKNAAISFICRIILEKYFIKVMEDFFQVCVSGLHNLRSQILPTPPCVKWMFCKHGKSPLLLELSTAGAGLTDVVEKTSMIFFFFLAPL